MILFQYILIGIIVLVAIVYLVKKIRAQVTAETCDSGCGKCGVAQSFEDIHG